MNDSSQAPSVQLRAMLPRTVVILGLVSLLNDAASEMITPLLPVFLTATLGAGPAIVGLVEGLAEATASVLKLVSGRLADRGVPAKTLVLGGYGLSNTVRPLIGLATAWIAVILLRFLDRVGKGVRTAPRDALIAGAVPAEQRGRAFGFHRSMDHAGAVVGPLLAFVLLSAHAELQHVFLASVLPGVLVLLLLMFGLPAGERFIAPPRVRFSWKNLHGRPRR
jgi:sugar phosphate permease